jgi:CMP-N,N'-diacetyllegionaminic acid synthase
MSKIVGVITARGGSKGIPRKNTVLLAGKPLIAWTIEAALRSCRLDRLIVSTDDSDIAEISRAWGAEVPFMRPPELAEDNTPHILVMLHALSWLRESDGVRPDYLMLLQPTAPLRTADDIDGAIEIAEARDAIAVVSVREMHPHPYLSKRILGDGTLADFVETDIAYLRRQALPPAYALNGSIYLNRSESLMRDQTFIPHGTIGLVMPPERSMDVDSPWDLHLIELVLRDRQEHPAR